MTEEYREESKGKELSLPSMLVVGLDVTAWFILCYLMSMCCVNFILIVCVASC